MITIEFKSVCEVHVINDYYFIDSDQNSFFGLNPVEREVLLTNKLRAAQYDVRNDIGFLLGEEDVAKLRNYHLRFLVTPIGFRLAIEVKSESLPGGGIRYRPAVPLPEDFELKIALFSNNSLLGNIANVRLNEKDNKIYRFSNDGPRVGGTLSLAVPGFDASALYKMGDLARLDGIIQEATEDNQGNRTKWQPVAGNGFVNEADRTLDKGSDEFPRNGCYRFHSLPEIQSGCYIWDSGQQDQTHRLLMKMATWLPEGHQTAGLFLHGLRFVFLAVKPIGAI